MGVGPGPQIQVKNNRNNSLNGEDNYNQGIPIDIFPGYLQTERQLYRLGMLLRLCLHNK